jgi:hypothetical protein
MFQITEETTQYYDIRSLEFFWMVIKTGKVTNAAMCLNVSQPAVSAAISKMEKKLGASLLVRGGQRQISLTEEGRRLYLHAECFFSKQREQILFSKGLIKPRVFTHQIVVSSALSGEIFFWLNQNCQNYAKENNINISLISLCVIDAVTEYNNGSSSIVIIPNLGMGTPLALKDELEPIPITDHLGIYAQSENLEYLNNNDSTLVILELNFCLLGLDISYMSSPIMVKNYEELINYLIQPGYYTMLTDHQLKLLTLYGVSLELVTRSKSDDGNETYRLLPGNEQDDLKPFQYGIAFQKQCFDIIPFIIKGLDARL